MNRDLHLIAVELANYAKSHEPDACLVGDIRASELRALALAFLLPPKTSSEPITEQNIGSIQVGDTVMVPMKVLGYALKDDSFWPIALSDVNLIVKRDSIWPHRCTLLNSELRRSNKE